MVAIGFDYRGWAPSEGEPGMTTFHGEYEDITAAYIFAQQQPEIDPDRIGLFGWGLAGPIVIKVGVDQPGIKAVAIANSFANGERMMRTNLTPAEYTLREARAAADRVRRVLTGKGEYVDCYLFSNPTDLANQKAAEFWNKAVPELVEDFADQYPGDRQEFPPKHSWAFFDDTLRINAEEYAAKLAPRGLLIAGSVNDLIYSYYESVCLFNAAGEGRVLYTVNGDHRDWMRDDHPEFVKFGKALIAFYDQYMK